MNEMNDYAGQRELIAENMMMSICIDLTKYLQELKQERKTVSLRPVECFCGFTTFIKIVRFGWPSQDQAGTVFHRRSPPEKYLIGAGTLYIFQQPFEALDVMLNISEIIPQLSAASAWYVLAIMQKKLTNQIERIPPGAMWHIKFNPYLCKMDSTSCH